MADNVRIKQEGAKEKLIKAIEALPSPYDFLNMQAADAAPEKKA